MIEIRDVATGRLLRTLEGHTGAVYDVAFSPDGRFLVSASADDTCKVWRAEDGLRLDTLPSRSRRNRPVYSARMASRSWRVGPTAISGSGGSFRKTNPRSTRW